MKISEWWGSCYGRDNASTGSSVFGVPTSASLKAKRLKRGISNAIVELSDFVELGEKHVRLVPSSSGHEVYVWSGVWIGESQVACCWQKGEMRNKLWGYRVLFRVEMEVVCVFQNQMSGNEV